MKLSSESQPGYLLFPESPRVKVVPLSCHCKLKSLVPLLHQLLQAPATPVEVPKQKTRKSPFQHIPLTLEFRYP